MKIKKGLSEKNIKQLINFANNDELVRRFTSDQKRFRDRESFEKWLEKNRKVYSLVDKEDNLRGISWFGQEGEGFTLALRIYSEARGKGLAFGFLKKTMEDFMTEPEYRNAKNKEWWLETLEENVAAIKIYEKLGFELVKKGESVGKLIFRRHRDFEFGKK